MTLETFHLFPLLPFELRCLIWDLSMEPRTVDVRILPEHGSWGTPTKLTSTTPAPAILHTCSESRAHALHHYKQAFHLPDLTGPDYIWINYTIDMVSIGQTYFSCIPEHEKSSIQRLTFEREGNEYFCRFEGWKLREFESVREIKVICLDDVNTWEYGYDCASYPRGLEALNFVDSETGQVITGEEMEKGIDDYWDEMDAHWDEYLEE
ncbi:2EXR domain-containing protein [Aspergillus stella-maris]|uniref:2EXR domain-containing protein n=1 Tax=Aspergillus stella-maris TaxID=1810926 RepID=UPI003CCD43C9